MKNEANMGEIISRLELRFAPNEDSWISEPFQVLIATILSQHTSDKNSHKAFSRLKETFEVRSEVLAGLKPEDIKPAIMCAGLSNIKSHRIVEVAKEIVKRFNGDLSKVFKLPLSEARETLMSIKGIGPKTTDVLLSFVGKYPVMPIDTNIFRVVDRIGLAKGRNYEYTRKTLERLIQAEKLRDAHIYLLRLGREICKSRNPLCSVCPLNILCDYNMKSIKEERTSNYINTL